VPCLGLDAVAVCDYDPATGALRLTPANLARTRTGAGPRHLDVHPSGRFVFVQNQMDSTIGAYQVEAATSRLAPLHILPRLAEEFFGDANGAAPAVHPSGRFVYASTRGRDAVTGFAIDQASGRLSPIGRWPTEGRTSRFIGFDPGGRFLAVVNETSHTAVLFAQQGRFQRVRARTSRCAPEAPSASSSPAEHAR
jgi:6-phosphogluconolactonase (cycloisomerase 2 family)